MNDSITQIDIALLSSLPKSQKVEIIENLTNNWIKIK